MTKTIRNRCTRPIAGCLGLLLSLQPAAGLAALSSDDAIHQESAQEQLLSQRRGGGSRGGGSRGGGSRSSGSRSSGSRSSGRTGFSSYSGSRQTTRQTTRGNRQSTRQGNRSTRQGQVRSNSGTRQSTRQGNRDTRQTTRGSNIDARQQGRTDRTNSRQNNRTDRIDTRANTRRDVVNNWDRYGNGWYSNNNWTNNRPWTYGWYGSSYYNNWGWYPGQAAAWGLAGLATFGVINSLVTSAQSNEVSYIEVPDSDYYLYYPSVTATGDVVTFEVNDGGSTVRFSADCRQGTLNGATPRNADEAQLLNAACQVAFGQ